MCVVYVCMYVCMYVRRHACMCGCVGVWVCVCVWVCGCVLCVAYFDFRELTRLDNVPYLAQVTGEGEYCVQIAETRCVPICKRFLVRNVDFRGLAARAVSNKSSGSKAQTRTLFLKISLLEVGQIFLNLRVCVASGDVALGPVPAREMRETRHEASSGCPHRRISPPSVTPGM